MFRYIAALCFIIACLFSCGNNDNEEFDFDGQLESDIQKIDQYLDDNAIQAYKDPSGIRFVVHSLGTGLPPKLEHTVKVNAVGKFMVNGTVFYPAATSEKLLSAFDIAGLKIGLALLPEGSTATLYIPSGFGYGNKDFGDIPANTNLIYEVQLLDVTRGPAETGQLESDVNTIDAVLAERGIQAVEDPSGLRYTIQDPGTGSPLTWYDKVTFNYTNKKFETGTVIATGLTQPTETFDSRVVDYLQGLMIGLQKIGKGGKATFFIPSSLGYGAKSAGNGAIPANTNLEYTVEIIDVIRQ
jgi:FKBP-type peptidyl-prolyl cis-trans isomerase